jgi:hypothetical protein
MPFFERNSFVLRQLLHPGWVKSMNGSVTVFIDISRAGKLSAHHDGATA